MKNQELSLKILELVGGKENVISATNCMTRLRITLRDSSKAQIAALKNLEDVLGVVEDATIQIILGPGKVKQIADLFKVDAGLENGGTSTEKSWKENKAVIQAGQKQSKFKNALRLIAGIFTPLIPAIAAAGLFNGLASLISQIPACAAGIASGSGVWYILSRLLGLFGSAFLGYFTIYTGIRSGEVFGATPALGGMIGAVSMGSNIMDISAALGLYNAEAPLGSVMTTGRGGVIGVIVGVFLLAKVEKWVRRYVPAVLDTIVTPLVSVLTAGTVYIFILMPAIGCITDGLVWLMNFLLASSHPAVRGICGFILSAAFLPMVLIDVHHGLVPVYSLQLERMGGVSLIPCLAMAGAGQVGAALAIYLKARRCKNTRMQKIILSALPAGVLGIGEPLIYGVTLPMGKPFITAGLGAGFGGAFCMLMGVQAVAWGCSGLVATLLMKTPAMMLYYVLGLLIAYIMGFIITWFGIKGKDVANA